jgi:hypothetical protein
MTPEKQIVEIDYTNYRGERAKRRVIPIRVYFSATEWHPEEQWLLAAWDIEKQADRSFALKDIHSWAPVVPDFPICLHTGEPCDHGCDEDSACIGIGASPAQTAHGT